MATLKELSDRTGYSPATISRILTGDPSLAVSEEARKTVLETAGRLNYAATKSRRGRTPKNLMHVAVAEMLTPAQQLGDPFYLYLHSCVEQCCQEQKFAFQTLPRLEEGFGPAEGPVDGIVAVGRFDAGEIEALLSQCRSLVFLNSSPDESRFDSVVLNYDLGIRLAVDYLLSLGHRRVGFIGPAWKLDDRRRPAPEVRRSRFIAQMEAPMDALSTAEVLTAYLRGGGDKPTAYLAVSEETALGAVRAFTEAGLRIPEDVSLVSFNDTPLSELVTPALTSVSTHVGEMSRIAVHLLAERAALPGRCAVRTQPVKVVVPPTLVLRESAAPPSN